MNPNTPLFDHWYQTLGWILDTVEKYPKNARFSIASKIADLSLDVLEKIIEAVYSKQKTEILNELNLILEKLRVLFRLSHDRRYISGSQYEYISRAVNSAGKMVGGWRKSRCSQS